MPIISRRIAVISSSEVVGRKSSAVEAAMDGIELAAGGVAGQGGAGGPEHGDDQVRVLEHLQRLEVQPAVAAAGQPVDGGVVVVGVEVQLGHRGPGVAVLDVGRADVEQLRQQGHAPFVGVIEVDPDQSVLGAHARPRWLPGGPRRRRSS